MYFTTIALRHHTDLKLVSQLVESGEARVRRAHDQRRRLGDAEEPPDGLQGYSDMTSTQKDKGSRNASNLRTVQGDLSGWALTLNSGPVLLLWP